MNHLSVCCLFSFFNFSHYLPFPLSMNIANQSQCQCQGSFLGAAAASPARSSVVRQGVIWCCVVVGCPRRRMR
ncbi:uncharacterized protein IWZ02DRAFT_248817 [Phyllosticta citriasiana]|uniref:uncharacterized protein n=1 Tax=Phyllosticta citriasiana TaxID=595635 RepID=UPI0030FDF4D5